MERNSTNLNETRKRLLAELSRAGKLEEELVEKVLGEIGPALLECLKFIQAGMEEGCPVLLDRTILASSEGVTRIGITFCTKRYIMMQIIEVSSEDGLTPLDVKVYITEEFITQIKSIKLLTNMIGVIGCLLKVEENPDNSNFYI